MSIRRVDHIAIAVESLDAAIGDVQWRPGHDAGLTSPRSRSRSEGRFLPVGDSEIELLEPLSPDSGIRSTWRSAAEGLHHICLEVDDIEAALAELKARGTALIDEVPKQGAHGRIAFIHPKGTHGVLIELVERA